MDSPELFVAFGAVMLVIALLGVAIDWFGKPMRHRKFVPKIYRFPDERQPRRSKVRETEWSDTAFVLPVAEPPLDELLVRYPDTASPSEPNPQDVPQLTPGSSDGPPTTQVPGLGADLSRPLVDAEPLPGLVTLEDQLGPGASDDLLRSHEARESTSVEAGPAVERPEPTGTERGDGSDATAQEETDSGVSGLPTRRIGWKPGDYVFNFTMAGDEPSAATVRTRYWKNVAATAGAGLFGATNMDRMAEGRPPERRNPRTNKLESMRLPHGQYTDTGGQTPIPEWPTSEFDPFADHHSPAPDENAEDS